MPRTRPWWTCRAAAGGPTPSSADAVDALATRAARRSGSARATGSASGRPTAPSGRCSSTPRPRSAPILVNINPAYRTHELELRAEPGRRAACWWPPTAFKTATTAAMIEEVAPRLRRPARRRLHRRPDLGRPGRRRPPTEDALGRGGGPALASTTRSTSSTPRARPASPRAPRCRHHNILNNGYFVGELLGYTEARPGLHPGALLPLLRHGDGQPGLHHPRRHHGHPRPRLRPGRHPGRGGRRALHLAVRRADDVHRRAGRSPTSTSYDLSSLAHRDHGRLALPGRGHEAGGRPHGHGRGHHLLRHDRDLTGLDPDPRRRLDLERRVSTVGRVHPHVEVKIIDPATGCTVPAGKPGELCTRGYSVMLGYWEQAGQDGRGHRRRPLDAHRRPGRHGRRRLRQHHRTDQGHGDPRRREHLPARDRGVPLHPPRHRATPRSSACPTPSTARS